MADEKLVFLEKSNERNQKKKPSAVKLAARCLLQNKNIILRKSEIDNRIKPLKIHWEEKLLTYDLSEIQTRPRLHSYENGNSHLFSWYISSSAEKK